MLRLRSQRWFLLTILALALVAVATRSAKSQPAGEPSSDCAEPLRLRVLTYNIHHGEGVDGKLDLERIAKVIRNSKPDLVALQEVDEKAQRTGSVDQSAELARLTNMHVAFGANIELQGGNYGNAVLSRWPLVSSKNHALPCFDKGEPRGVLEVVVEMPGESPALRFLATHFDHRSDDKERIASAKAINDLIAKNGMSPAVLAGDLNDVFDSTTLKELLTIWRNTAGEELPTFPSTNPERQIDYILVRPSAQWRIVEAKVLDDAVTSDHRALLAVIELIPK